MNGKRYVVVNYFGDKLMPAPFGSKLVYDSYYGPPATLSPGQFWVVFRFEYCGEAAEYAKNHNYPRFVSWSNAYEAIKADYMAKRQLCPWCEELTRPDRNIVVRGLSEELDGVYCSSCCLFHMLLSERTDDETFNRVQELINLPDEELGMKSFLCIGGPHDGQMRTREQAKDYVSFNCADRHSRTKLARLRAEHHGEIIPPSHVFIHESVFAATSHEERSDPCT